MLRTSFRRLQALHEREVSDSAAEAAIGLCTRGSLWRRWKRSLAQDSTVDARREEHSLLARRHCMLLRKAALLILHHPSSGTSKVRLATKGPRKHIS